MHHTAPKLHFFYDAQSRPAKVSYNGIIYTYLHNLQGDIVGIIDSNGTLVVEYKYDAWGKLLSTIGTKATTLGKLNPFRYRGYVYDEESGLYYLRSRYYHSAWRRFVNSDINLGIDIATFSHNIYAYCRNNPIIHADPTGYYVECLDGPSLMVTGGPHGGGYPVCSPETTKKVRKALDTTSKVVNAALIVGAIATLIFVPAAAPIAKFVLITSISAEISGRTNEKNGGHYYQGAGSAYVTSSIAGPNASVLKSFVTSSAIEMSSTYLNDRTTGGDEYAKIATKNLISSAGSGFIGEGVDTTTSRELMSGMTDNFATVLEISFSLFADLSVKDLN